MKQNISLVSFGGFAFTAVFGVLLHFLYKWTGGNALIAPFSAVNESTWEHMKLLYVPLFSFALIQSRSFKKFENYWCIKLASISAGLVLIPVLFYTYNGVFGRSPDLLNIGIFFTSAAVSFILETRLFRRGARYCNRRWLYLVLVCLIGVLFIIFTFWTPEIPIFMDPLTKSYGLG